MLDKLKFFNYVPFIIKIKISSVIVLIVYIKIYFVPNVHLIIIMVIQIYAEGFNNKEMHKTI